MSTVFRNRSAAFLWGFMGVWMSMLVVFTGLFLLEGPPEGHSPLLLGGVLAVFWACGLAATGYVLAKPLIEVRVSSVGDVRVKRRYLWRVEERYYPRTRPLRAALIEDKDSEGDPYFHARLLLPEGDSVDLWEGNDRDRALAEIARFDRQAQSTG